MENTGFETCHADFSILSSMVLAYTSKQFSIIDMDFNILGYLLPGIQRHYKLKYE